MKKTTDSETKLKDKIPTWIIDDNKNFCLVLAANLNQSETVECSKYFHSAKAALKDLETDESPPSVILLDIKMPGITGLNAIGLFKELTPSTQIIMLTSHDLDENIRTAMTRGASGYLLKSSTPEDIIRAIENVQKGGMPLDPMITKRLMGVYVGSSEQEKDQANLTDREKEIVKIIVQGLENSQIGEILHISRYTVETHLKNIFRKLETHNRQSLVAKALKQRLV